MTRKRLVTVLVVAAAAGLYLWFDVGSLLSLAALKANHQRLVEYYAAHRASTAAVFVLVYIVQTALSLPGAAILSLAAGAIFGPLVGTLYAVVGATIGATLAFLATRYLLRDTVQGRFGDRLEGMNRELEARGFNYLLFLRLVPVFPFFLINLAAGLTRLPLRTFIIATMIGIVPGGFVYVNAGASLATITSPTAVATPRVAGSFALLGLFALIPALYSKFIRKEH